MNERIKKLAEQADEFTDNKIQMQGEFHPDWHDIRDAKFAELIIKECISVAMLADFSGNRAWQRIKERFEIDGPIVIEKIEK